MTKKAYLYCDPRSLNDATTYYVGVIRKTLEYEGFSWTITHALSEIKNPDLIVTITNKYFFLAKMRFPKTKTIFWAQGVSAEEGKLYINDLKSKLKYLTRCILEPIAIKNSTILFCVSKRMVEYYKDSFGLQDYGQIITMPCYNLQAGEVGDITRYERPTFVYAGNASTWQCIDQMLDVYAIVERTLPTAQLHIYSGQKEVFTKKLSERGIKNFFIKYVSVDELQKEMQKYKYGFVIRDNHIINQVATPTKLNSYLSSYLIPIFSDGIADFAENINLGQYTLLAHCPLNPNDIATMILNFEKKVKDFSGYKNVVDSIFKNYYNDEVYQNQLRSLL